MKAKLSHLLHRHLHNVEHTAHVAYLGACFFEFHHFYTIMAGVTAVVLVLSWFCHAE